MCRRLQELESFCNNISGAYLPPLEMPQPFEDKITVLVMNWKRPANLKRIVTALDSYDEVKDIVLVHNRRESYFNLSSEWTKVVEVPNFSMHDRYGMRSRLKVCLMGESTWVLMLDDDLILQRAAVQDLVKAKRNHPNRIIGFYGRAFSDPKDPRYNGTEAGPGEQPIIIGRVMMTDTRFCSATLRMTSPLDDLAYSAVTKWGAEDIYMSLIATKMSGRLNLVLPFTEDQIQEMKPGSTRNAISRGAGHYVFRDEFVRLAFRVLQCFKPPQQFLQST